MTTLKSGNTKTVSWSSSSLSVLWLPLRTDTREVSEDVKIPEIGDDIGLSFVVSVRTGGGTALGAFVCACVMYEAREPLVLEMSRSQSDFPVDSRICGKK